MRAALEAAMGVGNVDRERDLLSEAIGNAAVKSGIYRPDLEGMTGPQLMQACDDMAECILAAREPVVVRIRCEYCAGRGEHWGKDDVPVMCGYCEGSGQIIAPTQPAVYACPTCGTGMEVDPTAKPAPTQPHEPKVDLRQFRDAQRYRWLRDFALHHEEADKGTPYIVYGLGMDDAEPCLPSEIDAMVDHSMSQGVRWKARNDSQGVSNG